MGERTGRLMNLIIVSKFFNAPKRISLRQPGVVSAVAALMLVVAGSGGLAGYWLHSLTDRTLLEVTALRDSVAAQQDALAEAREQVDHELNALAMRLGELQAHSNRINALGERLTRIGQLDDGEFDFTEMPAIGGPESIEVGDVTAVDYDIRSSLDAFADRLSQQSQQLGVIESMLLQRDVDANLMPTGRPVRTGYVSSAYGMRADPFTGRREFHRGIDFHGERGADVLAVADGVVSFSGAHGGYGNMVDIDHGNGYMTRYGHNHQNLVKPGQRVRAGDVIARMGATGRATGVHLHFEVWHNDRQVNPHQYLKGTSKG
jgi:murein DD-endopeptidase MepM/ murein hydrolase activator NlpD